MFTAVYEGDTYMGYIYIVVGRVFVDGKLMRYCLYCNDGNTRWVDAHKIKVAYTFSFAHGSPILNWHEKAVLEKICNEKLSVQEQVNILRGLALKNPWVVEHPAYKIFMDEVRSNYDPLEGDFIDDMGRFIATPKPKHIQPAKEGA